jgi:hypothetical protein
MGTMLGKSVDVDGHRTDRAACDGDENTQCCGMRYGFQRPNQNLIRR